MKEDKKELRRTMIERRLSLASGEVSGFSRTIWERVKKTVFYSGARILMSYVSFRQEVETLDLIRMALAEGKKVVVPCCRRVDVTIVPTEIQDLERDLVPGTWGILEPRPDNMRPVDPREIDLVLVPGVAFDLSGNRLGYGAGYYDRFLPLLRPEAVKLALAYELQILPDICPQPHDCPVEYIATEKRLIDCRNRG